MTKFEFNDHYKIMIRSEITRLSGKHFDYYSSEIVSKFYFEYIKTLDKKTLKNYFNDIRVRMHDDTEKRYLHGDYEDYDVMALDALRIYDAFKKGKTFKIKPYGKLKIDEQKVEMIDDKCDEEEALQSIDDIYYSEED